MTRSDRASTLPDGPTARLQPDAEGRRTLESFAVFEDIELETASMLSDWGRSTPADMARERALAEMAEAVFSGDADPRAMQGNLLLGQGADFQARGMVDRAIAAYTDAIRHGSETPTVHFLLGLLYREQSEYARAIEHLGRGLSEPNLALGARFAIGEAYYAWEKTAVALEHLLEALHLIDAHTVTAGQKKELSTAYARLSQDYVSQGESADVRRFAQSILDFLSKKGWGEQVVQMRKQLNSLASGGILVTLAETLVEPRAEMVTTALCQIQEYMERSLYFTALEECYWAIHQTPYFLPLHLYMADVLIAKGQSEAAVGKYIVTAETYQSRSETKRAIAVYQRALDIAPMDVQVREKLIDLMLDERADRPGDGAIPAPGGRLLSIGSGRSCSVQARRGADLCQPGRPGPPVAVQGAAPRGRHTRPAPGLAAGDPRLSPDQERGRPGHQGTFRARRSLFQVWPARPGIRRVGRTARPAQGAGPV